MTTKLNLEREHQDLYRARQQPALVDVGPALFLTARGKGDPAGEEFNERVAALYSAAYTVRAARKAVGDDYRICRLEGLWWLEGNDGSFDEAPREQWCWQLLIRAPDFVSDGDLRAALEELERRGKTADGVSLERFDEGRCAQALHRGSYDEEAPTIERIHAFVADQGLEVNGRHHEIYLSDPRRTAEERLKTILRYPVR
ncbi:MAG: GyrI-like domain-containing protein [Planctomycetota bacterium]